MLYNEKPSMGDKLYELLPDIYRQEDANIAPLPLPLKRYLKVLGAGMDKLAVDINEFNDIHNIDLCPDDLLDIACNFFGFKFPANTTPNTKRRILKVLPLLYQHKGTHRAILYLVRAMFGVTSDIEVYCPKYEEGMTSQELRRIFLKIQIDDTVVDINSKMDNFSTYAEIIRPVNRKFIITLSTLFTEELQSGWGSVNYLHERLKTLQLYDHKIILDGSQYYNNHDIISLKLLEESYNMSSIGMKATTLNKYKLNSELNTMTTNICFDRIKQSYDYTVNLNVQELDVTRLVLDPTYSKFILNKARLNRDLLTSTSAHHVLNVKEEETFKPKHTDNADFSMYRPKESYSKLNKSKLNGGLILTHKTHYDTIKIKGVIQEIL